MIELLEKFKSKEYQVKHSSLAKISSTGITYEQCRNYACKDITSNLTRFDLNKKSFIIEIPEGSQFHFIGRVDTSRGGNEPVSYYETFESRNFVSFSTINHNNISRYKGNVFFVYNIIPEDIVHIFPMDSDLRPYAKSEDELTWVPSLWLTLHELEELTAQLKVYNQITCKSKRNGQILKPFAVIAFNEINEKIKKIAEQFEIGCIIVHPDKNAINYTRDLLYDSPSLNSISRIMEEMYEIPVKNLLYLD